MHTYINGCGFVCWFDKSCAWCVCTRVYVDLLFGFKVNVTFILSYTFWYISYYIFDPHNQHTTYHKMFVSNCFIYSMWNDISWWIKQIIIFWTCNIKCFPMYSMNVEHVVHSITQLFKLDSILKKWLYMKAWVFLVLVAV